MLPVTRILFRPVNRSYSTVCLNSSSSSRFYYKHVSLLSFMSTSSTASNDSSSRVGVANATTYANQTMYKMPEGIITNAMIKHYKEDTKSLARWLDFSVVKYKGRAFDADIDLIPYELSNTFPLLKGLTLNDREVNFPADLHNNNVHEVTLVCLSFKHYGFTLVKSWLDPYKNFLKNKNTGRSNSNIMGNNSSSIGNMGNNKWSKVSYKEICFVEYGFMSFARKLFADNLKKEIDVYSHDHTILSFGKINDFAASLLLPSKYIGYVFLIDKNNKVRWRGCGTALDDELDILYKCTEKLLNEQSSSRKL